MKSVRIVSLAMNFLNILHLHLFKQALLRFPLIMFLGPGDKLEVNYFGSNVQTVESFIARNGEIFLPLIGPVSLAGLKFEEARNFLNEKVKNQLIGTEISINLAELRSISVYVLGEAYKPGLYTMSG